MMIHIENIIDNIFLAVVYTIELRADVMQSMNVSISGAITCEERNPVLGIFASATLSASKTFMQYKIESMKSNVLIHEAELNFNVHSESATTLRFIINIYGEDITLNTDCTTYSSQRLDFGPSIEVDVASAGLSPSSEVNVDVKSLVQRAVNRGDWSEKKILTLVISVSYDDAGSDNNDQIIFHDTSNCKLKINYRDFSPSSYFPFCIIIFNETTSSVFCFKKLIII